MIQYQSTINIEKLVYYMYLLYVTDFYCHPLSCKKLIFYERLSSITFLFIGYYTQEAKLE